MYNYRNPFMHPTLPFRNNYKKMNYTNTNNFQNIPYSKTSQNNHGTLKEESTDSENRNTPPLFPFIDTNEVVFEIFGVKIYFDDLLLILILLFLYQEGIQDEYLFISLILLLLN